MVCPSEKIDHWGIIFQRLLPIGFMSEPEEIPKKLAYLRLKDDKVIQGILEGGRFRPLEKPEFPSETIRRSARETADLVVEGLRKALDSSKTQQRLAEHLLPLPPDALIDQNDPRVPTDWFKRSAKTKLFPSIKQGQKTVARWADVQKAWHEELARQTSTTTAPVDDPRDALLAELGLERKK